MLIKVYNDGDLVHDGTLKEFLQENDNDEWLTEQCSELKKSGHVEFNLFHSGKWEIIKE